MTARSAYSDAERAEREYIEAYGECMATTVVETWLDGTDIEDSHSVRAALANVLETHLTSLELAELAADCVGNPTFEMFMENQ